MVNKKYERKGSTVFFYYEAEILRICYKFSRALTVNEISKHLPLSQQYIKKVVLDLLGRGFLEKVNYQGSKWDKYRIPRWYYEKELEGEK